MLKNLPAIGEQSPPISRPTSSGYDRKSSPTIRANIPLATAVSNDQKPSHFYSASAQQYTSPQYDDSSVMSLPPLSDSLNVSQKNTGAPGRKTSLIPTNNTENLFSNKSDCPSRHALFNISSLGFGNVEKPLVEKKLPYWAGNKLSISTRLENIALQDILVAISKREGTGGPNASLETKELHKDRWEKTMFEKSLAEILKLIDQTRSLDDTRAHANGPIIADDRKKNRIEAVQETQANVVASMFSDHSSKSVGLMRKPLRTIMMELQKRIELLKTNQAEWEAFQSKIAAYKSEELKLHPAPTLDLIDKNKLGAVSQNPASRIQRMQSRAIVQQLRMAQAIERAEKYKAERQKQILAVIAKKEQALNHKKNDAPKAKMGKLEMLQKRWYIAIALASRLSLIRYYLEEKHKSKAILMLYTRNARIIQKQWKAFKMAEKNALIAQSLSIIKGAFHEYVKVRREKQKHKAANHIRQFFKDVHDVSKLMKIVKKYRYSVVRCQNIARNWLEIRKMRILCISKFWDKCTPAWWAQRKQHGQRVHELIAAGTAAAKKGEKQQPKQKAPPPKPKVPQNIAPAVFVKISDPIKEKVIREDYAARRILYRNQVREYNKLVDQRHQLIEGDGRPPPGSPIWNMFVSQEEMMRLIEKGFAIQHQEI